MVARASRRNPDETAFPVLPRVRRPHDGFCSTEDFEKDREERSFKQPGTKAMAARARLTRNSLAATASPSSPSSSRASSEVPANGKSASGGKKKAKKADDRCPKCAKQSLSSKAKDASRDTWIGCDA